MDEWKQNHNKKKITFEILRLLSFQDFISCWVFVYFSGANVPAMIICSDSSMLGHFN